MIGNSDDLRERAITLGKYIAENNSTIREAAARWGISKSTVHIDVMNVNG